MTATPPAPRSGPGGARQLPEFSIAAQEAAMDTITACRLDEPIMRRAGFTAVADFLRDNAKAAERWLVRGGKP